MKKGILLFFAMVISTTGFSEDRVQKAVLFKPDPEYLSEFFQDLSTAGSGGDYAQVVEELGVNLSTFLFICPFDQLETYGVSTEMKRVDFFRYVHGRVSAGKSIIDVENVTRSSNGEDPRYMFQAEGFCQGTFRLKMDGDKLRIYLPFRDKPESQFELTAENLQSLAMQ